MIEYVAEIKLFPLMALVEQARLEALIYDTHFSVDFKSDVSPLTKADALVNLQFTFIIIKG